MNYKLQQGGKSITSGIFGQGLWGKNRGEYNYGQTGHRATSYDGIQYIPKAEQPNITPQLLQAYQSKYNVKSLYDPEKHKLDTGDLEKELDMHSNSKEQWLKQVDGAQTAIKDYINLYMYDAEKMAQLPIYVSNIKNKLKQGQSANVHTYKANTDTFKNLSTQGKTGNAYLDEQGHYLWIMRDKKGNQRLVSIADAGKDEYKDYTPIQPASFAQYAEQRNKEDRFAQSQELMHSKAYDMKDAMEALNTSLQNLGSEKTSAVTSSAGQITLQQPLPNSSTLLTTQTNASGYIDSETNRSRLANLKKMYLETGILSDRILGGLKNEFRSKVFTNPVPPPDIKDYTYIAQDGTQQVRPEYQEAVERHKKDTETAGRRKGESLQQFMARKDLEAELYAIAVVTEKLKSATVDKTEQRTTYNTNITKVEQDLLGDIDDGAGGSIPKDSIYSFMQALLGHSASTSMGDGEGGIFSGIVGNILNLSGSYNKDSYFHENPMFAAIDTSNMMTSNGYTLVGNKEGKNDRGLGEQMKYSVIDKSKPPVVGWTTLDANGKPDTTLQKKYSAELTEIKNAKPEDRLKVVNKIITDNPELKSKLRPVAQITLLSKYGTSQNEAQNTKSIVNTPEELTRYNKIATNETGKITNETKLHRHTVYAPVRTQIDNNGKLIVTGVVNSDNEASNKQAALNRVNKNAFDAPVKSDKNGGKLMQDGGLLSRYEPKKLTFTELTIEDII
jgi:hypothetical protein